METAIVGLFLAFIPTMAIFFMQRGIKKRDAERERKADESRDERRENDRVYLKFHSHVLKSVMASIALGEANAIAIKNGKTNGETEAALRYAQKIKHEQKEFLHEQGVENILKKEEA